MFTVQGLKNLYHNLVVHPVAGLLWALGYEETGDWVHDNW